MKRYIHLIILSLITVGFAIINSLIADLLIRLIIFLICAFIIGAQINLLSNTEKNKFDELTDKLPRVIHWLAIVICIDTLAFNIINYNEVNEVYSKCGSGYLKYNSVAIKQLEIDILAIQDIVFNVGREITIEEFNEKYREADSVVPYAALITVYTDGFQWEDIKDTIYLGYKAYKHFSKVRANVAQTFISYILFIWEGYYLIGKLKNKQ